MAEKYKWGGWRNNLGLDGTKKNPREVYVLLAFFWIFFLIWMVIVFANIDELMSIKIEFNIGFFLWLIFILIPFCILFIGLWGIIYTIKHRIYNNRLYEHLKNGTMLEKKAIITKFKHFRVDHENSASREWYVIVANIWKQKYKSEDIEWIVLWARWKDIDKKFYEKRGIPYSPRDPKYNNEYKWRLDAKKKEINAKLAEMSEEYVRASRFKKIFITWKSNKLNMELIKMVPISLPYKGNVYFIGDEITVLVDPDNPRNYIM